jgi:hypothetical protein
MRKDTYISQNTRINEIKKYKVKSDEKNEYIYRERGYYIPSDAT